MKPKILDSSRGAHGAEHFLNICDIAIGKRHDIIKCPPIGSCVVVMLYNEAQKIGGAAHCLLPQSSGLGRSGAEMLKDEPAGKYVDTALPALLGFLEKAGVLRKHLTAKLAGGACVIEFEDPQDTLTIGRQNVERAVQMLKILGIPIKAMDTGGRHGRKIDFFLATGEVQISSVKTGTRVI